MGLAQSVSEAINRGAEEAAPKRIQLNETERNTGRCPIPIRQPFSNR